MRAYNNTLLGLLQTSRHQFVVPIFQRNYSWTARECSQLWRDIMRVGTDGGANSHFIGSIVYVDSDSFLLSGQDSLLVIDGQQRLATTMLLVEALARAVGDTEPVPGFSARELRNYYLRDETQSGDRRYKMLLNETDRDAFIALMSQREVPVNGSRRVVENFEHFKERIDALKGDFTGICRGLSRLLVVDVGLDRNTDNPQLIFESMNSTGRRLSQADLIRNFVLMGQDQDLQSDLWRHYWRPMEDYFGQEAYVAEFDKFIRYYLTLKTGDIPNVSAVYEAFKAYAGKPEVAKAGVEELVADVKRYAEYYCAMALGKEKNRRLAAAFQDLREFRVDVAYPFLLELYDDHAHDRLTANDLLRIVRLVEAYAFRRAVCSIPTNSQNKTFATFARSIDKSRYYESVCQRLMQMPSYRRFPQDEEFKREIAVRDLYNFPRRSYWLRRMENDGREEPHMVDTYTVEHILPQNENLSAEWREALGPEWRRIRSEWLHTLGNLTLTGYNSAYGDRPFPEKRDMEGGFKESPLRLNHGLGEVEKWDEDAIKARAAALSDRALDIWSCPPKELWESAPDSAAVSERSQDVAQYPQLQSGSAASRALFDELRKAVLSLDACVSEEFLKHYIAYKAETNFVDVVPQNDRLQLTLNMPYPDLVDSRGMARDVTEVGHRGNGDVEVVLAEFEDLPYVAGLIRQSLERQLADWGGGVLDSMSDEEEVAATG